MEKNLSVLIEALEVAQLKGCYTLQDAVTIANAIGMLQRFIEEATIKQDTTKIEK